LRPFIDWIKVHGEVCPAGWKPGDRTIIPVCPAGWKPGDRTIIPNPSESLKYFSKVQD